MKVGKILLLLMTAMLGAVAFVGCVVKNGYDRAIVLDEAVNNTWAEVDNQLKRRFDLIDNLVETVKGFAAQEEKIFLGVAEARKSYFQANSTSDKAKAATAFESALSRLLVLKETYPELKSNESFLKLQDSIEGTENRLTVARNRYNESVREVNTFTRKLMGRLYASLAGVGQSEYFKIEEEAKATPKVDFSRESGG